MANYLVYCIQNIETLGYNDPFEKKSKLISVNVPSYIDAFVDPSIGTLGPQSSMRQLDYKAHGSFTSTMPSQQLISSKDMLFKRPRDAKFDEKMLKSGRDMALPEDGGNLQ